MRHHDHAIARFVERAKQQPDVVALLLTGSLATGTERPTSDVDLVLVVTDAAWEQALAADRIMFVDREGAGYEGGYFDVKLATVSHITAAPDRGDEPVRHSLGTAKVLYDRGAGLQAALAGIGPRDASERRDLVASFVADVRLHGQYFLPNAVDHGDPFLVAHAAVHLGLAAGRAVLADAGVLYPNPKDLMRTLRSLPHPGARFADAIIEVARMPSSSSAEDLVDLVEDRFGHVLTPESTLSRFVHDNELAWFRGTPHPEHE